MKLNKFIWDNYKESSDGKKAIKIFDEDDLEKIINNYFIYDKKYQTQSPLEEIETLECIASPILPDSMEKDEAYAYFLKLIEEGIKIDFDEGVEQVVQPNDFGHIQALIPVLSLWLYSNYPDFF